MGLDTFLVLIVMSGLRIQLLLLRRLGRRVMRRLRMVIRLLVLVLSLMGGLLRSSKHCHVGRGCGP